LKKIPAYLFLLLLMAASPVVAQAQEYSFLPSEHIKLEAYYNWGPFWVHAGDAILKADTITYQGKKCVKLDAEGYSLKKWDFVFDLEDHYTSIVSLEGFKPLVYEKHTIENGFWINNKYKFNWKDNKIDVFTHSIHEPAKDTTYVLQKKLFDVLTATYYLRTLDASKLNPGDTIPIPIITDGKFYTFRIIYSGKGVLKKKKERISCNIFKIDNITSTFFSSKNPLRVFVSDNPKKFIIYVEANIIVGSIKAYQEGYLKMRPDRNTKKL